MTHASHAITSLTLENFRNYRTLTLALDAQPVVLRGANGAGKTNILEAISMLAPGRGLRGARLREMDRVEMAPHPKNASQPFEHVESMSARFSTSPKGEVTERALPLEKKPGRFALVATLAPITSPLGEVDAPEDAQRIAEAYRASVEGHAWVVAARITACDEEHHIGTGRDPESAIEKRVIKINGERVRGATQLAAHTCIQWLTPSMDQIFIEGSTARRKFFDRLVYGFAPEHAARVTAYETAMRERNKLLSEDRGRADPYWLAVLEQQMAEHAVAITLARQEMLARLAGELAEDIGHFPRAQLRLTGLLEGWLEEGTSALEVEAKCAERLMQNRREDAASGRTIHGCHRSEWVVTHSRKNMEAAQCSTGEQKALLLSIMLAAARARANWCGMAPILLLDEVIAHLDVDKRACLFDLIRASRIQAWMTGTDAGDFTGIATHATMLTVEEGTIR